MQFHETHLIQHQQFIASPGKSSPPLPSQPPLVSRFPHSSYTIYEEPVSNENRNAIQAKQRMRLILITRATVNDRLCYEPTGINTQSYKKNTAGMKCRKPASNRHRSCNKTTPCPDCQNSTALMGSQLSKISI